MPVRSMLDESVALPDGSLMDAAPRSGVLERVTLIMDCLGEAPGQLLLEDVAEITGLPRSTAFRLLRQLSGLGWVQHDTTGYLLGPRLARRGLASDFESLRAAACPALNDLASRTGMVAHLGVMQGGFVDYVDKIGAGAAASVPTQIGTRIFAPESTCGMAILSWLQPEEVDAIIEHSGVHRAGGRDTLHRELGEIRRRKGVAYRDGSGRASGVSSVGAAIVGADGPIGAISVARRGSVPMRTTGPLVLRAAESIAAALFERAGREQR